MEFPEIDFDDENACFEMLLKLFHPRGLPCPHCGDRQKVTAHRRHGVRIVVDFQCKRCRQVFNAWSGTPLQQTHHTPSEIMRLISGLHQGIPTTHLARELHCHRGALSKLRHRLEPWVTMTFGAPPHKKKKEKGRKRPSQGRTSHTAQIGKESRRGKKSY